MTLVVPCPGQQHAAQVQPIGVMPGMDTTINIPVNFAICDTTAVNAPPAEAPPPTDHSKIFATIENGRLVFVVRGAEAVRRIFPTTPSTVVFSQTARHTPLPQYGAGDVSSSQQVLVNCRNSDESADAKHRCDVKH
jgi:hypothetical protein